MSVPRPFKELPDPWKEELLTFLDEKDFEKLSQLEHFLKEEEKANKIIYPPKSLRYKALESCPPDKTKVVILGQDPYHGEGQAMGLSFSVPKDCKLPPSLKNIYKELYEDLGFPPSQSGDLTSWSDQGVLLLNTVLTVEKAKAGAHQKKGWEVLTKAILESLSQRKDPLVFILWGSPAQKSAKAAKVFETTHHKIITSVHPSPLSSYRGFFGSKPFSKANNYLKSQGIVPINWQLP